MAQLPKDKSIDDAQTAMIATLEKLAESPITAEEVDRARQQASELTRNARIENAWSGD